MMRSVWLASASLVAIVFGLDVTAAQAADAKSTAPEVSEVIVTGSHIGGTPQDSALPVAVLTTDSLEKQGSPSLVQIVKSLPGAYGSYGESNRLLGNVGGIASVNLRGFGAGRTLVLLNGQRLVSTVPGGGEDINLIPTAAIGRVEILKDGAATAYGSDAIAGVVNFITRRDLQGVASSACGTPTGRSSRGRPGSIRRTAPADGRAPAIRAAM
jgi:iron complex outermembrane receptor protein